MISEFLKKKTRNPKTLKSVIRRVESFRSYRGGEANRQNFWKAQKNSIALFWRPWINKQLRKNLKKGIEKTEFTGDWEFIQAGSGLNKTTKVPNISERNEREIRIQFADRNYYPNRSGVIPDLNRSYPRMLID